MAACFRGALLAYLPAFSAVHLRASSKIVDGVVVSDPVEKYPFFALVAHGNEWGGCGASMINATHGVSAAHCFGGGESPCRTPSIDLWVGHVELKGFAIHPVGEKNLKLSADVICHPNWDGKCSHGSDIVLLKFKNPPQPLPAWLKNPSTGLFGVPLELDKDAVQPDDEVISLGFGLTEAFNPHAPDVISTETSQVLREVQLSVFSQDDDGCKHVYDHGYGCSDDASMAPAERLTEQFCAGDPTGAGKDTCSGDSGSPVLVKKENGQLVQVGIVSYGGGPGGESGITRECGSRSFAGIYSSIPSFSNFLHSR